MSCSPTSSPRAPCDAFGPLVEGQIDSTSPKRQVGRPENAMAKDGIMSNISIPEIIEASGWLEALVGYAWLASRVGC